MEEENNIEKIDGEIKNLKKKKKKIKQIEERKLRLRSNNCGKSNILMRVATITKRKIDHINEERDDNGFDCLSGPKITQLYFSHKKYSPLIERDIVNYNTLLDVSENGGEFNDK